METRSKFDYLSELSPVNSNPRPVYVRADREAGCTWGLVIKYEDGCLFCLTPNGIRYYGCTQEHDLLVPGDAEYDQVRDRWRRSLATLP